MAGDHYPLVRSLLPLGPGLGTEELQWGKKHKIYVVLDLHAAPLGQNALATVADVPSTDLVARLWEGSSAAKNQDATVAIRRTLGPRPPAPLPTSAPYLRSLPPRSALRASPSRRGSFCSSSRAGGSRPPRSFLMVERSS